MSHEEEVSDLDNENFEKELDALENEDESQPHSSDDDELPGFDQEMEFGGAYKKGEEEFKGLDVND